MWFPLNGGMTRHIPLVLYTCISIYNNYDAQHFYQAHVDDEEFFVFLQLVYKCTKYSPNHLSINYSNGWYYKLRLMENCFSENITIMVVFLVLKTNRLVVF